MLLFVTVGDTVTCTALGMCCLSRNNFYRTHDLSAQCRSARSTSQDFWRFCFLPNLNLCVCEETLCWTHETVFVICLNTFVLSGMFDGMYHVRFQNVRVDIFVVDTSAKSLFLCGTWEGVLRMLSCVRYFLSAKKCRSLQQSLWHNVVHSFANFQGETNFQSDLSSRKWA